MLQNVEDFHPSNNLDTVVKVTDVLRTRDESTEAHLHVEYSITKNKREKHVHVPVDIITYMQCLPYFSRTV